MVSAMRVVIQRVGWAAVAVDGRELSRIGPGLLVLLGVAEGDEAGDAEWLAGKIARMRIFGDGDGKMNLAVGEIGGEVLVISQFTLHASTRKGNRPSFVGAAAPEVAEALYLEFCRLLGAAAGRPVGCGEFGADMKVSLLNDGPVTLVMDSRARE